MPFIYAHNYCAYSALENAPSGTHLINEHSYYFDWGCQGPDIWFYHLALPWKKGEPQKKFGNFLHEHKVSQTFKAMIQAINALRGSQRDKAFVYVAGFLAHYALDTQAHPYIHYRTQHHKYHTLFEADLDSALLQSFGWRFRDHKVTTMMPAAALKDEDFAEILEILYQAVAEHTNYHLPLGCAKETAEHAVTSLKFISDPYGLKRPIVCAIERLIGKPYTYSCAIYKLRANKKINSLNTRRIAWQAPWYEEIFHSTFFELIEKAAARSAQYIGMLYDVIYKEQDINIALQFLDNLSFDTGQPCESKLDRVFFDCAYEA